jgi:putative transposase
MTRSSRMYARGMTTREIRGHLEEIYGIEVSPTLISNVTDAVIEEVKLWQGRPLEEVYPIVYLDALMSRESTWKARRKCWGYGWRKRKERSSGCRC